MHFKVTSRSSFGIQSSWNSGASSTNLTLTIPPEFHGPGGGFSPEDLYAMALLNCFIATFKVIAEKSKLEFKNIYGDADLVVDRDEAGRPWMASIQLIIKLESAEDQDRALKLLEKTSQQCMILNSTKTLKTFHFQFI